jgi:drug/metabolite transporter (DMT)-like permease
LLNVGAICVFAGAAGQILWNMAFSMKEINDIKDLIQVRTIFNLFTDKYIFLGLIFYVVALILWLGAMSTLDVSFMYPMLSLGYVVTAVFAFIFLGEHVSLIRWLGIALVVVGCFLALRYSVWVMDNHLSYDSIE